MKTVYDVRQSLKRFGTYIYTGDRFGDLDLMEMELQELYRAGFLPAGEYSQALFVLKRERALLEKERGSK